MTRPQPPRLAQWLLEHALPEPERTEIPGDLAESFERGFGQECSTVLD